MNHKIIAEAYRGGLDDGFVTENEIVSWADSVIACNSSPEYIFIELSLSAGDKEKISELLSQIQGKASPEDSLRIRLGFIATALAKKKQVASRNTIFI
ncbi:MAG: hypothetical protein HZA15_03015 [Nitrospirae bacterium]|nr:hypothetical protein [Nitrospirota bacterium]